MKLTDVLSRLDAARNDPEAIGVLADQLADLSDAGLIRGALLRALWLDKEKAVLTQKLWNVLKWFVFRRKLAVTVAALMRWNKAPINITVGDVCKFSAEQLLQQRRGMGPIGVGKLRSWLAERGLCLRGDSLGVKV